MKGLNIRTLSKSTLNQRNLSSPDRVWSITFMTAIKQGFNHAGTLDISLWKFPNLATIMVNTKQQGPGKDFEGLFTLLFEEKLSDSPRLGHSDCKWLLWAWLMSSKLRSLWDTFTETENDIKSISTSGVVINHNWLWFK